MKNHKQILKKIEKLMQNPWRIFRKFNYTKIQRLLPDKVFLKLMYRARTGKKLNLKNPATFNEKIQWLKLYDRKPVYTQMVDKYEAKKYIANIVGEQYIVPTYGVWNHFDEIDFDALPDSFVLKTTHDSGGVVICRNKKNFDVRAAREKLENRLKDNFYWHGREWPYKNVKPRIIAEELLTDLDTIVPRDYKIVNFNGNPEFIQVDIDRFSKHMKKIYSTSWEELPFDFNYPTNHEIEITPPAALNKLLNLAKQIASKCETDLLRTDFYVVNGKIYVGELTLYPANGYGCFNPDFWDEKYGHLLKIGGGMC